MEYEKIYKNHFVHWAEKRFQGNAGKNDCGWRKRMSFEL